MSQPLADHIERVKDRVVRPAAGLLPYRFIVPTATERAGDDRQEGVSGVATEARARVMIERHVLNPEAFWGPFGAPSLARDVEETGGMHENYDAERGVGLWSPSFGSWNLLAARMVEEAETGRDPARVDEV